MFIFTLLGSIFQMICFIIISKWKLLQNAEHKFSESTNSNDSNNDNAPTNSLGSFTNGWCSKSYKQGLGNEPLTTKPLKLAATVTIRVSGSRSEMIMGSNKHVAPSDGIPKVRKHLRQEGNPVLEWEEVVTHDSENKCYVFLQVKCWWVKAFVLIIVAPGWLYGSPA